MAIVCRHATSLGLLLIVTLFLIVAYSGNKGDATGYTQGIYDADSCKFDIWFGLEGYKQDTSECPQYKVDEYVKYTDDSAKKLKYKDDCIEAGGAVLSMLTFGLIALIAAIAVTFMRLRDISVPLLGGRMMNVIVLGAFAAFMFFGWTSWFACHNAVLDAYKDVKNTTISLSAGFAMVFLNMVLAIIVLINEFLVEDEEQGPMANYDAEAPAGGGLHVPDNSYKQMDQVV